MSQVLKCVSSNETRYYDKKKNKEYIRLITSTVPLFRCENHDEQKIGMLKEFELDNQFFLAESILIYLFVCLRNRQ